MRLLLLLAVSLRVSEAQNDCSRGACYPPVNDLLLGRAHLLQASSTCGLTGSEIFCTPYQQRRMKCCPCDSRNPDDQLAHTVRDVLTSSGPDRWWQSKKEVNPVTLQLDLKNLFQLDNLMLSFMGPRPNAFVIERTEDGRTWQPALYLATDCGKSFPGVPTTTPLTLDQTYCHTLPPVGLNPYQDHRIEFSPLRQYMFVSAPNSRKIEEVSGLKGLRLRLTELGDVPRLPGRALSRFYALKEMRVIGSCMCHGHADRCLPEEYNDLSFSTVQVEPRCDCQHNTAGVNCERCADLYNDLPWRPAEEGNTHACKRCECNNHAQHCHFDQAVYEASGWISGGVCEGCTHHTAGPKCDQCAPGYQPNPYSQMDRPDACIRCTCSSEGTANGARCEDNSGSCQCKVNVEDPRCDRCKRGYYGLSASNPEGCNTCSCSPDGSLSQECDPITGQCPCRAHFHGLTCDVCSEGYWKQFPTESCRPCDCDSTRSISDSCDQLTGQCQCRPGFGGRTCATCPDGTYGDPLIGCQPCPCDAEGTLPEVCNKQTGACLCRQGVTGARCDSCMSGHCDSFPACKLCPSCFVQLDQQRQAMSVALERLSPRFPSRPGGDPENFGPRIRALEASLNQIRNSVPLPPGTVRDVDKALSELERLRNKVDQVDKNLSPLWKDPGLDLELDKLQALLDNLSLVYKAKKDAVGNSISPNNTEAFTVIKNAYDESTDAFKKANASGNVLQEAANVRKKAEDIQNQVQPVNTRDLSTLNQSMASQPDLTPAAKKVCGSLRSDPCTPLQCGGADLCPPDGAPLCDKGAECVGGLPLSKRANADVQDVKERLDRVTRKITEATEMLEKAKEATKQVRQSAKKLSDDVKQPRNEIEENLKDTQMLVKELKDFLSDPSSNLTQIQKVSDWILKAKLPISLASLKEKLKKLKDLAGNLPNSTAVLKEAEPQLEAARKLLEEAQSARDIALGTKADVDGLLNSFGSAEESLSDLEDKLEDSMALIDSLNNNLTQSKNQLSPAEEALEDIVKLIKPMKPQLDELKELLQNGAEQARDAEEDADRAEDEAAAAAEDLKTLEEQLDQLKDKGIPGPAGEAGPVEDRLVKLQKDAGALTNTTDNMMKSLEGKADSLRKLQDEILQKSSKLEGLEAKLQDLVGKLQKKASDLRFCQG